MPRESKLLALQRAAKSTNFPLPGMVFVHHEKLDCDGWCQRKNKELRENAIDSHRNILLAITCRFQICKKGKIVL